MNKIKREKLNNLINTLKESCGSVDTKLIDFVDLLDQHGFFLNLEEADIDWCMEEVDANLCLEHDPILLSLPVLCSNRITIGMDGIYDGQIRIGIDPSYCFNKTGDCSVLAYFPMKKREYKRFIKLFNKLLNMKHNNANHWFRVAKESWCGSYALFGR